MGKVIKYILIFLVIFIVIGAIASSCSDGSTSTSTNKVTCPICGKTYSSGSNYNSVKTRGMCNKCYSSYSYAKAALGAVTVSPISQKLSVEANFYQNDITVPSENLIFYNYLQLLPCNT